MDSSSSVFSSILEFLDIGIIACRLPQWTLLYANQPATGFTGLKSSSGDLPVFSMIPGELSGFIKRLAGSPPNTGVNYHHGDRSWKVEWLLASCEDRDFPGDKMAIIIIRENTQQQALEEELNRSNMLNRELDAILDCCFDGIWVLDGEGVTVRINKATERIAGIKAGEVIGRHVSIPRDKGIFATSINLMALEERRPITAFDEYWTGKHCLTSSIPIFNEKGHIWRVVANIRDMTHLDELKEELIRTQQQARMYQSEVKRLEEEHQLKSEFIGSSPAMEKLISVIRRIAKVDSTVLVMGETGVGKDLVAHALHDLSARHEGPFIKVNCGAIPDTLLESELFGYEKGSFTGAKKEGKPGMFELAQGGTIFLDEVAELPLLMQVKLLQVVEDHPVFRVGGTKQVKMNVRIIAATNRNLEEMVEGGSFRKDLYYRLKVLPVLVPTLRERKDDIPLLVAHFLNNFNSKLGSNKRLSPLTIDCLMRYGWPGNVRELRTLVEQLLVLVDRDLVMPEDLPANIRQAPVVKTTEANVMAPLKQAIQELEKSLIARSIQLCRNSYEAAGILKVNQSTVVRKAKKYGLSFNGRWRE